MGGMGQNFFQHFQVFQNGMGPPQGMMGQQPMYQDGGMQGFPGFNQQGMLNQGAGFP